jgi:hypothetical protein
MCDEEGVVYGKIEQPGEFAIFLKGLPKLVFKYYKEAQALLDVVDKMDMVVRSCYVFEHLKLRDQSHRYSSLGLKAKLVSDGGVVVKIDNCNFTALQVDVANKHRKQIERSLQIHSLSKFTPYAVSWEQSDGGSA